MKTKKEKNSHPLAVQDSEGRWQHFITFENLYRAFMAKPGEGYQVDFSVYCRLN